MKRRVIKLSLKIFFCIFSFAFLVFFYVEKMAYKSELTIIKSKEIADLANHNSFVTEVMNSIISDVHFISKLPDLRDSFKADHASGTLLEFSKAKKVYDQIRYLDNNGQEQIRVNWNSGSPIVIKQNNLQNKKGRYYFEETLYLEKDQIFISPMDLNVEYGVIEIPIKPMLRIGTPLYDIDNKKKGIVLLNYFGKDLIDNLKKEIISENSQFYFLNQDGYWFYSNDSNEAWGFMYPDKKNITFPNKFSKRLWDEINENNNGQIQNDLGIFTFNSVYPLNTNYNTTGENADLPKNKIDWELYKWKLVTYIPNERLKIVNMDIIKEISIIAITFTMFSLFISFLLSKNIIQKKDSDKNRLLAEKKYHVLFEKAGESIVVTDTSKTLMTNERSSDLFEYTQEELATMPVEQLFHTEDKKMITKMQRDLFNNEVSQTVFEYRAITKYGKEKWVEIRPTILDFNYKKVLLYFFLDITSRKVMERELKKLATIDSLTQCYNRRFFSETLEKEIERTKRLNGKLTLIMMDIDLFKKINDQYGHDVGDSVLMKFAEISKIQIRNIDTIGRLGGEEFALLLPNCSEKNGFLCAERVRIAIEKHKFSIEGSESVIGFTVSLGVTEIKYEDSVETSLKRVDNALYMAKNRGRNKTISI